MSNFNTPGSWYDPNAGSKPAEQKPDKDERDELLTKEEFKVLKSVVVKVGSLLKKPPAAKD